MTRVFDKDLRFAGIPKRDANGKTADIHSLRHTFGTMLARSGVSLQVAQRAMRHSTPALTSNLYTHLGLLDLAEAVETLPALGQNLVQNLATNPGKGCQNVAIDGKNTLVNSDSGARFLSSRKGNRDRGLQGVASDDKVDDDGGRYWIRTSDPLRVKQVL